jgi:hypothetical protein
MVVIRRFDTIYCLKVRPKKPYFDIYEKICIFCYEKRLTVFRLSRITPALRRSGELERDGVFAADKAD